MKKLILIFVCLGIFSNIHGQKNLHFGILYHNTSISDKIEDKPYFRDRLESGSGFGVYLLKHFNLSENLGIRVGLQYDKSAYALNTNDLRWPSQIDPQVGLIPQHISTVPGALGNIFGERNFHSISLPAILCIRVKDFEFGEIGIRAGVMPKYYLTSSNRIEVDMENQVSELDVWMYKTNLSALIGLDLLLYDNHNFSISVVPSFNTEIFSSSLNDKGHRIRFASLGIEIGLL